MLTTLNLSRPVRLVRFAIVATAIAVSADIAAAIAKPREGFAEPAAGTRQSDSLKATATESVAIKPCIDATGSEILCPEQDLENMIPRLEFGGPR